MTELVIEKVTKDYGSVTALEQVDLTINPGITGLMGNNGAGKSTLIKILTTLQKPTTGTVKLNGRDIFSLGDSYRQILGYMPQQQQAYRGLTVHQFLDYMAVLKEIPAPQARQRIGELLERFHLQDQRLKKCEEISGGMRQRLLLSAALLNDPLIVILDEPTAGLDPIERATLREALVDLPANKMIILATHIVSDIEFIANRLVFLDYGQVRAEGNQEQLLSQCPCFLSSLGEKQLREQDSNLKMVNISVQNGEKLCRFVSHEIKESEGQIWRVPAGLDDLYLDLLSRV